MRPVHGFKCNRCSMLGVRLERSVEQEMLTGKVLIPLVVGWVSANMQNPISSLSEAM